MIIILHFQATNWILVNNNVRPSDLINGQHYVVLDLKPSTKYILRITAHNSAGSTVKEYRFSTLGDDGRKIASEEPLINQSQAWNSLVSMLIFLPILAFLLVISLIICVQRGRRITHGLSGMLGTTTKHHARTSKAESKNDRGHARRNEPDLTDGLSNCSVENAYEMSDVAASGSSNGCNADLNYGFGAFLNVHQTFIGSSMDRAAISNSTSPKRPTKLNEAVIVSIHQGAL